MYAFDDTQLVTLAYMPSCYSRLLSSWQMCAAMSLLISVAKPPCQIHRCCVAMVAGVCYAGAADQPR